MNEKKPLDMELILSAWGEIQRVLGDTNEGNAYKAAMEVRDAIIVALMPHILISGQPLAQKFDALLEALKDSKDPVWSGINAPNRMVIGIGIKAASRMLADLRAKVASQPKELSDAQEKSV